MEFIMNCDVCSLEFQAEYVIPKVLECGHTFCLSCIQKLQNSQPNCPKCRVAIPSKSDFPTNFSILGACETFKSFKYLENHLICSVQIMKNKLDDKKEILLKRKSQITSSLDLIKNGQAKLQELDASDGEELDFKKANEILDKVTGDFKKIENCVHFNFWELRTSIDISFKCFETPDEYLMEIYSRLHNEEKIYAVEHFEDVVKYGKVSLQNNMILFHALSLTEEPEQKILVWFDELKRCITDSNFGAFLKLSCNERGVIHTVTIELQDTQLTPQFVKLCTGECGPTYKACPYIKGTDSVYSHTDIATVDKYLLNDSLETGRIDYCSTNQNRSHSFLGNDVIVIGKSNGGFSIVKLSQSVNYENVVGKVTSPSNLHNCISYVDVSKLNVVDCGMFYKF